MDSSAWPEQKTLVMHILLMFMRHKQDAAINLFLFLWKCVPIVMYYWYWQGSLNLIV